MNTLPNSPKAIHRFAVFAAFSTFFLIIAGGLVTSTGSGLAVPDWPLSYGQVMPPMVGGIFYEHGHRMIATFVGFLTVVLAIWLWRKDRRRWVRILGVVAVAAVILQGVLGGLTVLYLLPTAISVSHATLAQTFFCLMASLALFTSAWWQNTQPTGEAGDQSVVRATAVLVASIYVQLILGALMRHTQSGLAVPDFPLAYGFLVPPLDAESVGHYNAHLVKEEIRIFADGPITANQILIHMLHRGWAVVVVAAAVWVLPKIFRLGREDQRLRRWGMLFSVLLASQIALGAYTVLLRKEVWVSTAHVANGALLLCLSVLLMLHAARMTGFTLASLRASELHQKEVLA